MRGGRLQLEEWLDFGPDSSTMEMFSAPHLISLTILVFLCAILLLCRGRFETEKAKKTFRYVFAVFISLQQASIYIWYTLSKQWSLEITLPLQLCDLSLFLSVAVLITRRQLLTELLYYWGIGGATQALLTPDIGPYTFPHFVFYQYFISHYVILLTCIYMIAVEKFRPSTKSVLRTFAITNIYALLIFPVNRVTGGNYLFLSWKPAGGSILDLLGPWPWYILSLEAVALFLFTLLYLPFAFKGGKGKDSSHSGISL